MLWSPQEDYVLVTHGRHAKGPGSRRWLVSLQSPDEYGFEADHLEWIDRYRLAGDINTPKIPGAIQVIDAKKPQAELVLPPVPGRGYKMAAIAGRRVTVEEFLNHWNEGKALTAWEYFEPACFDLDLDTMKKRSIPCPGKKSP